MNLTYEELQALTETYLSDQAALLKQVVPVPSSIEVYDSSTKKNTTLFNILRAMQDDLIPDDAKEAYHEAWDALLKFQNIMTGKIHEAKLNNYNVSLANKNLYAEYLKATDIPERQLKSVMLINKKNIAVEDHPVLVELYTLLGLTHYTTGTQRDIVYFNPDQQNLDSLKNMLIMNAPSLFQHNYPNLWDWIKEEPVDANPLTGCMSMVIHARKS